MITIPSASTTIDCNQKAIHPYLRIQLSLFMSINNSLLSKDIVYSCHFCSWTVWQCALATSKIAAPVHHNVCQIASACIRSIKYCIPIGLTWYVFLPTIVPLVTAEYIRLRITYNCENMGFDLVSFYLVEYDKIMWLMQYSCTRNKAWHAQSVILCMSCWVFWLCQILVNKYLHSAEWMPVLYRAL